MTETPGRTTAGYEMFSRKLGLNRHSAYDYMIYRITVVRTTSPSIQLHYMPCIDPTEPSIELIDSQAALGVEASSKPAAHTTTPASNQLIVNVACNHRTKDA